MHQYHTLLRRQLKRSYGADYSLPEELLGFLQQINDAYNEYDTSRHLLERAVDLSSSELNQANAELRGVFAAMPDSLLRIRADGSIMNLAHRAQSIGGVHWHHLNDLPDDAHAAAIALQFRDAAARVRSNNETTSFEYIDKFTDAERYCEVRLLPFVHSDVIAIVRDVTDRRILEAELVQAQKLESIGQLAAGIAHEINTPVQYLGDNTQFLIDAFADIATAMASLMHVTEAVAKGESGMAEAQIATEAVQVADIDYLMSEIPAALDQSLSGLKQVAELVRAMKDFSHPGSAEKTAVDLNRAIESTVTVARNEWKYSCDVVMEFDPDLPMVRCLPGELNQVILNILVNAPHAIAERPNSVTLDRGLITIKTKHDGNVAEISVSDTGAGIPEPILNKIFDPFFTTKPVGKGTGQGLAITRTVVVEKHAGTISVDSTVGIGTTFTVRLPIDGVTSCANKALVVR